MESGSNRQRTLHFIYTVPQGTLAHRGWRRVSAATGLPPLHRWGNDALIGWKHPIRAPHSISYNLLKEFKKKYRVRFYSLYEHGVCDTAPGDIVVAQPAPELGSIPPRSIDTRSVTYRTFNEKSDITKIIIMPYSHDEAYTAWWKDLVKDHGRFCIFISGRIWFDTWDVSPFRDLPIREKFRMDLGVDMADYPRIKTTYNLPGKRGYLYIGHTGWYKNIAQLEAIARAMPGHTFGHIGGGHIEGWKKIANFADLTPDFMRMIAREYDIFVNVSTGDPQVTTVLENMAFGFLVAATPESGHSHPSMCHLSTTDVEHNRRQLLALQDIDEVAIEQIVTKNLDIVSTQHAWPSIRAGVLDFVERVSRM